MRFNNMVLIKNLEMNEDIENFYEQVEKGWEIDYKIESEEKISNIIIACSDNTESAGNLLKQYIGTIPVIVCNSSIPKYASKETCVIVLGYGYDNEIIISMYREALKQGCKVISISNTDKLREISNLNNKPHIILETVANYNYCYGYLFFSVLKILQNSKLIESQEENYRKTLKILKHNNFENLSEELSEKLNEKTLIFYGTEKFKEVVKHFKLNINKFSNIPSYSNSFPGLSFSEPSGFGLRTEDHFVLILKGENENIKISKLISKTKDEIRNRGVPVTEMAIKGDCYLTQIFSSTLIGDWISLNLANKLENNPYHDSINGIREVLKR